MVGLGAFSHPSGRALPPIDFSPDPARAAADLAYRRPLLHNTNYDRFHFFDKH